MFSLALLLALSAGQPANVCVGHHGPECQYSYKSLAEAQAKAPDGSIVMVWVDHKLSSIIVIDRNHLREKEELREERRKHFHTPILNHPNGDAQPPASSVVQI
jgi:hypothetical protein